MKIEAEIDLESDEKYSKILLGSRKHIRTTLTLRIREIFKQIDNRVKLAIEKGNDWNPRSTLRTSWAVNEPDSV